MTKSDKTISFKGLEETSRKGFEIIDESVDQQVESLANISRALDYLIKTLEENIDKKTIAERNILVILQLLKTNYAYHTTTCLRFKDTISILKTIFNTNFAVMETLTNEGMIGLKKTAFLLAEQISDTKSKIDSLSINKELELK